MEALIMMVRRSLKRLAVLLLLVCPALAQERRVLFVAPPGPATDKAIVKLSRQLPKLTFLSPADPDLQRLVAVPYSSRPLLAVGRYDARGQLQELVFSQDCSQPEVAIQALQTYLEDEATRPRIDACRLTPDGPLEAGQKLALQVEATPGARLSFQLGDQSPQAMQEVSPGSYAAEYVVTESDYGDFPIQVTLDNARGQATLPAGPVALRGVIMPQITRVDQIDSYTWLIQGKAAPQARVRTRLQLGGYERQEFEVQADDQGHFQEEIDLGRWIPSTTGRFELSARAPEGREVHNPEQVLTFQSSESLRPVRVQRSNWAVTSARSSRFRPMTRGTFRKRSI